MEGVLEEAFLFRRSREGVLGTRARRVWVVCEQVDGMAVRQMTYVHCKDDRVDVREAFALYKIRFFYLFKDFFALL